MITKHVFVPLLDVSDLLPFGINKHTKSASSSIQAVEAARRSLEIFVKELQKEFKEPIWYMGVDIIADKMYERFIFDKGGFFEIVIEKPVAMNAHFTNMPRARKFAAALKSALKKTLKETPERDMLLSAINAEKE